MAKFKRIMGCGCVVGLDYDNTLAIFYCPTHKAAPELYEACNKMWSYLISRPAKPKELTDILLLCEKGLAKADTKKGGKK